MSLCRIDGDTVIDLEPESGSSKPSDTTNAETWYHEGPPELKEARFWLAGRCLTACPRSW